MGGSGGNTSVQAPPSKPWKLAALNDEELRKWSKQYGYSGDAPREEMLKTLNAHADGILVRPDIPNLPLEKLPFTLTDIQRAIPAHCFKRSLVKSMGYLVLDLVQIALLGWAATHIGTSSYSYDPYVWWPLYIFCQGTIMTGVWVLAHECGHQSFSDYESVNNAIGTVLHSALLVPYHPWRITHKRHHENTGSCENDEVFAPSTRTDWKNGVGLDELRDGPIANLLGIIIMLTVGWLPGYLVFGITGPGKYRGQNVNHFSPTAVFFKPTDYWKVVVSDLGFFAVLGAVGYAIWLFGFAKVALYYLLPLMVTNYHLVLITYLQHTATYVPHFRGTEWTFLRGALCTVDRSFGFVYNSYLHHITDTHVCHHLFSKMPFYHAQEATAVIKQMCGKYYLKDDTPIWTALYNSFHQCQFVEDEGSTVFYKNLK